MSAPSNYDMAHECLRTAENAKSERAVYVEAMAAQTYATLALVDAVNELREFMAWKTKPLTTLQKGATQPPSSAYERFITEVP